MFRTISQILLITIFLIISFCVYLSIYGINTDKLNGIINEKISQRNSDFDIKLNKIKIFLNIGSFKLEAKTKLFILPIGVGAHFREWGIDDSKIKEYNWWEEDSINGLFFAFTPSRHFSGRGLFNQNSTLWGSWVIKGENKTLFFSGDGGYDDHFNKIGEKYGPFDIALVECGQYNKHWKDIHMVPEESALAIKELNAKVGIPIHWGAFSLSTHEWNEPPVRIKRAADSLGVKIATPIIGEVMMLDSISVGYNPWWEQY